MQGIAALRSGMSCSIQQWTALHFHAQRSSLLLPHSALPGVRLHRQKP